MDYLQIANSWPVWLCAGACIAGTVVMVACVKFSKKMPWLKEYGLGIAIVIGIVVGALVR